MTCSNESIVSVFDGDAVLGFDAHRKQIPGLKIINDQLGDMFYELASLVTEHEGVSYTIQRVQYQYHLQRISEINSSMVLCLKEEQYISVEALSRVSLESIVNFLYLLGEKDNERASGFLKGYLKKNKYKARKWFEHSSEAGDQEGMEHSSRLLESMESGLKSLRYSKGGKPKMWPDTIMQKFSAVNLKGAYVTLFASSSDSVHHGAEDVYNRTMVEYLDKKEKENAVRYIMAESASFAIYLAVCAIEYSAEVFRVFCNKLGERKYLDDLSKLQEELNVLHMEHENHHASSFK